MGEPEWVIETRELTKVYGTHRAVDRLSLRVPRGSVFGLLGQNGAGKSTTLRMLLGLVKPSGGEVLIFGQPMASERMTLLPRIGCLIEGPAFYPYLTGYRNLMAMGSLMGGVETARVQECLQRVGLGDRGGDRYRGYSTGMRQRLGIAAALLHDPELVIVDEPMSGLDPPAVVLVRDLIGQLRDEGKTVLVSSHMLHEVELACDQVAIIEKGEVIAQGEVKTLIKHEVGRVDVSTEDVDQALEAARALDFVQSAETSDGGIRVNVGEAHSHELNKALVGAGVRVTALVPRAQTLEELFHELAAKANA